MDFVLNCMFSSYIYVARLHAREASTLCLCLIVRNCQVNDCLGRAIRSASSISMEWTACLILRFLWQLIGSWWSCGVEVVACAFSLLDASLVRLSDEYRRLEGDFRHGCGVDMEV